MKKKALSKIQLHRETLLGLDGVEIAAAVGGATGRTNCGSRCNTNCATANCSGCHGC
jgi:hypothetical protein